MPGSRLSILLPTTVCVRTCVPTLSLFRGKCAEESYDDVELGRGERSHGRHLEWYGYWGSQKGDISAWLSREQCIYEPCGRANGRTYGIYSTCIYTHMVMCTYKRSLSRMEFFCDITLAYTDILRNLWWTEGEIYIARAMQFHTKKRKKDSGGGGGEKVHKISCTAGTVEGQVLKMSPTMKGHELQTANCVP